MIETNEGVRVRPVPTCALCGSEGTLLYQNLRDRLFDAPGSWSLMRCQGCGLVWLNPQPVPEDIGRLYKTYFTHDTSNHRSRLGALRKFVGNSILATRLGYTELAESSFQRVLGRILSWVGPIKEIVELSTGCLDGLARGRLLDVGCGSGAFLAKMKELGWEVIGVEPDGEAVKVARNHFGLNVYLGTLEEQGFPENGFDAITMNHVIEHLCAPVSTLKECYRIIKPGGKLVITTPNVASLGARLFGEAWRGWEPPRHLYLFSRHTLRTCAERAGFRVIQLRTTARSARFMWAASRLIRQDGTLPGGSPQRQSLWLRLEALAFYTVEHVLSAIRYAGEELVMVATKETSKHGTMSGSGGKPTTAEH